MNEYSDIVYNALFLQGRSPLDNSYIHPFPIPIQRNQTQITEMTEMTENKLISGPAQATYFLIFETISRLISENSGTAPLIPKIKEA